MTRKLLLTVAVLAAGSALVVSGATVKPGGTIVYDNQGDFQFIEQTLALWPTGPDWRDEVICIARPSELDDWTRGCLQGQA